MKEAHQHQPRLAADGEIDDTVLDAPCLVADVAVGTDPVTVLKDVVFRHRLRVIVTGAYLGNGPCLSWRENDGHGYFHIGDDGSWRLVEPEFEILADLAQRQGPVEAAQAWLEGHREYEGFEGYLIRPSADGALLVEATCWVWSADLHILVDPIHRHRGVPVGWAYLGLAVALREPRTATGLKIAEMTLHDLDLPVRVKNYLAFHSGITTVEKLLAMSRSDLLRRPGIGRISLREIDQALSEHGLWLPWAGKKSSPPQHEATDAEKAEPIESLGLSPVAVMRLKSVGMVTVGDLLKNTLLDLQRVLSGGYGITDDILICLQAKGLALREYRREPGEPELISSRPTTTLGSLYMAGWIGGRARWRLHDAGIETLGELAEKTVDDLRAIPGIGKTTLAEIQRALEALGFSLKGEQGSRQLP